MRENKMKRYIIIEVKDNTVANEVTDWFADTPNVKFGIWTEKELFDSNLSHFLKDLPDSNF